MDGNIDIYKSRKLISEFVLFMFIEDEGKPKLEVPKKPEEPKRSEEPKLEVPKKPKEPKRSEELEKSQHEIQSVTRNFFKQGSHR